MLCNLKTSGRVPKIPIGKKKIKIPVRLKITEWSKNLRSKNPRAYVCACVCVRVYVCVCIRVRMRVHLIVGK